jgi:uncharacterized membrane protein
MSKFMNFIKTTAIGGLLVIVPVAIVLFVLAQIFYALYSLTQSLTTDLGLQINDALIMVGIAVGSLIGLCFLTGLIVRTRIGLATRNWMNRNVARRIPMYGAISSLTQRFAGLEGNKFAPVEVDLYNSDSRAVGFLIELLPDDRCTVFIPSAPVATVGNIYVISRSKITKLDASVADTLTAISQWGVETGALYGMPNDGGVAPD